MPRWTTDGAGLAYDVILQAPGRVSLNLNFATLRIARGTSNKYIEYNSKSETSNSPVDCIFSQDGVHTPTQASKAERVQILRCGSFAGIALRPQALLQQCCDQVLPNVHGVSASISPLQSLKIKEIC